MAVISFRPLREDEFDAWAAEHTRGYAEGMIAFAGMSREHAERKAALDIAAVNVWGGNEVARSLYRSLGYVEVAVEMKKKPR